MHRSAFTLVLSVTGVAVASADGDRGRLPPEVPNPWLQPQACALAAPGRICDPDGILSSSGRQKVADILAAIRAGTHVTCPVGLDRGFDVAVAIVQRISPEAVMSKGKETAAEGFARELGDTWGVGDVGCGNGALMFVSIEDRFAYIKTSSMIRGMLTDELATAVVDNAKPLFREAKYDDAMLQAVLQILDVLSGKDTPTEPPYVWELAFGAFACFCNIVFCFCKIVMFVLQVMLPLLCIFVIRLLLMCVLWLVFMPIAYLLDAVSALQRACLRRRAQHDVARVQREVDRDEFDQTMCPICLEDLKPGDRQASIALDCRHSFHRACIERWLERHDTCPLCRSDVEEPLAPADTSTPEGHHRRLCWYLSRLQRRHRAHVQSDAQWFIVDDGIISLDMSERGYQRADSSMSYAGSLDAWYEGAMHGARSGGGVSMGFGGGGGFSGGGGGGGGW